MRKFCKRLSWVLTCLAMAWMFAAPHDAMATRTNPKKTASSAMAISLATEFSGDRTRITVKGKGNPHFRTTAKDNQLTLTFDKAIEPDIATIKQSLAPYVTDATLSKDKKRLTLTTDKEYANRSFISEDGSGIDVMGIDPTRHTSQTATPTVEAKTTTATAPENITTHPKEDAATQNATKTGETTTASPTTSIATAQDAPVSTKPQTPEEIAAAATKKKDMQQITSAVFNDALKALRKGDMLVQIKKGGGGAEFHFPWGERTAAAAYMRGKNLWIIFNKPTDLHINVLKTILPTFIDEIEQVNVEGHTVLRLHSKLDMSASVRRERDSHTWVVTMTRRGRIPATSIVTKVAGGDGGLRPNLQVDMLQAAEAVRIPDTVVGDNLIVVPDYEPSEGLFPARKFVDFNLLRTAQGLAIEPYNDKLRLTKTRSGLKIGADKAVLTFTPKLPEVALQSFNNSEQNTYTFFPYERWHYPSQAEYTAARNRITSDLVQATDQDTLKYRSQLAGLLLGNGYYLEALGMLDMVKSLNPTYYNDYQLAALHGAANFMAGRYDDAHTDFSDPSLENEDEMDFWNRSTEVMLGISNRVLDYMDFHEYYGKLYPPPMRRKLAMLAADQAIAQEHYNEARKIGNVLLNEAPQGADLPPEIKDYVDLMMGRIYATTGKLDNAKELLEGVASRTKNNYYRANAVYALTLAQYGAGAISAADLIKKLEPLRIIWRGDALEVAILNLLGDTYAQEKDYLQAMRAWKELIRQYPNAPDAINIAQKMAQTFTLLFNDGEADRMKPLQALALYYEFRDLTPIGKDGDKMIQNLADRLAMVDLLDRSAALLAHQVKYRLEKEERSRVGARLALLFLFNKEPQKALEALQLTGYGNNPENLQLQRAHLTAESYHQLGDTATALKVIDGDFSDEAKAIRLDIYWDNKDWKNVAKAAENILSKRPDLTAELTPHEAQTLLRLAVSYTFMDDSAQLKYLRDYFTPLLGKSPLKESFDFITNDTGPITHNNLSQLSTDLGQMKFFLEKYRKQVHETGLSKTVK